MRVILGRIAGWLAGRKTYLVAGVIVAVTVALVFFGRLTPTTASEILVFGVSAFAVTFRSALQRHQDEVLMLLTLAAKAGEAAAAHNSAAAGAAGLQVVKQGVTLVQEIKLETSN